MQLIADELGQPTMHWVVAFLTRRLEARRAAIWCAGERLVERAFQIGQEAGEPDAVFVYGATITYSASYQGRGEEIIDMLEQSVSAYPGIAAWRAAWHRSCAGFDRRAEAASDPRAGGGRPLRARRARARPS